MQCWPLDPTLGLGKGGVRYKGVPVALQSGPWHMVLLVWGPVKTRADSILCQNLHLFQSGC